MTDYKQLCAELAAIENALMGGATLVSNQGQALDGYSALASFRSLANRARAALAEPEPEGPTDEELNEPLGDLIDKWCQEGMRVKPHGTSFPLAHYVASKAYQYALRKGRPVRAALAEPERLNDYKVASDETMRRIRSTTKRWKLSLVITTNDSAIDTRLGHGIWKVLDTENEILESMSIPTLLSSKNA